jgi:hypothetical protein
MFKNYIWQTDINRLENKKTTFHVGRPEKTAGHA